MYAFFTRQSLFDGRPALASLEYKNLKWKLLTFAFVWLVRLHIRVITPISLSCHISGSALYLPMNDTDIRSSTLP